jgi:Flp pilus assembly protein TadD
MKQYRQLNDALKTINADFKRARDYFEKLYRVNPDPRYATYLGNIYTRFSNKQKADYYYGRAKQ